MTIDFRAFLGAVLLASCNPNPDVATPPTTKGCVEFDHETTRNGQPVTCRMVWCEKEKSGFSTSGNVSWSITGGVSTLWCADGGDAGHR